MIFRGLNFESNEELGQKSRFRMDTSLNRPIQLVGKVVEPCFAPAEIGAEYADPAAIDYGGVEGVSAGYPEIDIAFNPSHNPEIMIWVFIENVEGGLAEDGAELAGGVGEG